MARGKNQTTEDKLKAAREKAARAKAKYNEALSEVKALEKQLNGEMRDALYDQLYRSDKSYDEIMAFLNSGNSGEE